MSIIALAILSIGISLAFCGLYFSLSIYLSTVYERLIQNLLLSGIILIGIGGSILYFLRFTS
jgi:hypothetical protein